MRTDDTPGARSTQPDRAAVRQSNMAIRLSRLICLVVGLVFLAPAAVHVQEAAGSISGVVREAPGNPLPGVTVEAVSPALSEPRRTVTNRAGRYELAGLPAGSYALSYDLPGFASVTRLTVISDDARDVPMDVVMRVGPLEETLTFRGPSREPRTACGMTLIPAPPVDQEIARPPDRSRRYTLQIIPPGMCR